MSDIETKTNEITEKKVTKEFEFKLTEPEIATLGHNAADIELEISKLEYEFEKIKKEFKGKIEVKAGEMRVILSKIRDGVERRMVECTMIANFMEKKISYVFEGTTMEERAMTEGELQIPLIEEKEELEVKSEHNISDIRDAIREETSAKTKIDMVTA